MAHWDFFGWLAYASLWVAGIILAADGGLKLASDLRQRLVISRLLKSKWWAFAPLACIVIATAILLGKEFGWIGSGLIKNATIPTDVATTERLEPVIGQKFENVTVDVDGKLFDYCTFENVTFRWFGGSWGITNGTVLGLKRLETHDERIVSIIDMFKALGWLDPTFAATWKHIPKQTKPDASKPQ